MSRDTDLGLIDYALAAVLRLGGDTSMVDVEDVALEAYRIAPDRFRWRRHDLPNLELVRVILSDANKKGAHLLLRDDSRKSRMLSVEGIRRAKLALDRLDAGDTDDQRHGTLRRQDLGEIARMERHPAYLRWRQVGIDSIDAIDLADLARCSASTPLDVFGDRLRRSQTAAAYWNRDELARFLGEAADHLPQLLAQEN
jgi:hypothetical protein